WASAFDKRAASRSAFSFFWNEEKWITKAGAFPAQSGEIIEDPRDSGIAGRAGGAGAGRGAGIAAARGAGSLGFAGAAAVRAWGGFRGCRGRGGWRGGTRRRLRTRGFLSPREEPDPRRDRGNDEQHRKLAGASRRAVRAGGGGRRFGRGHRSRRDTVHRFGIL